MWTIGIESGCAMSGSMSMTGMRPSALTSSCATRSTICMSPSKLFRMRSISAERIMCTGVAATRLVASRVNLGFQARICLDDTRWVDKRPTSLATAAETW